MVWSRGRQPMIRDWDAFKSFVEHASFTTVKELLVLYNARFSPAVSRTRLYKALKRIGYTHKKDLKLSSSGLNPASSVSVVKSRTGRLCWTGGLYLPR